MHYAFSIMNYIRRWRHTRGYGVHSPLAYIIVKECIRPDRRYGFYCDAYLDFEYHEDRRGLRQARMIIRLLHLLRPSHVWFPNADKRIRTAIGMSFPKMRVAFQRECPKDTDFIISFSSSDLTPLWKKMNGKEECGMLSFGAPECETNGATLELQAKDFQILLRRIGMQPVTYEV